MTDRITESLAEFLERAQRPGLLGIVGRTVAKQCQRDLEDYFTFLGKRVKEMKFEELADPDRGLSEEYARHAVQMRMHNLLRNRQPFLKAVLQVNIAAAIDTANKISLLAESDSDDDTTTGDNGPDGFSGPTDYPGMTADEAAKYAAEQTDAIITGLDETSMQSVMNAVSAGIKQKLGVPGTAGLIRDAVEGMSTWRSKLIANYQMNDAMSEAFLRKLRRNAVEYKQWILGPNPCEICEANAAQGAIPVDEDFDSGDDAPPAHGNCVCAVAGARAPL